MIWKNICNHRNIVNRLIHCLGLLLSGNLFNFIINVLLQELYLEPFGHAIFEKKQVI
jgi:hypothetical protein